MADTTLLPSPTELAPLTNSAKKPTPDAGLSSGLPPTLAPIKSISVEHEDGSKTVHIPAPIAKATSEASAPPDDGSVAPNPAIAKSPALLPSPDYAKMVDSPESIPSVPTSGKSLAPVGPKPSGASADSSSNGVSNTSSGGEQSLGAPEDAANLTTQLKPLPQFSSPPNATPSLEPQGGKHAFTRFLSRLTGLSAETPKPGQPYTGPIGSSEKIKAGAKFASAIGLGLTAAAGRPEESELAMQMPMKQRQMELETAALKNEAAYRSGMLTNNANKNTIAEQKNVGNMRAKGYVPNEASPGEYRPMSPEEITADPSLSLSFETKKAAQDASYAKADYQKTLSYYQAHPNAQVQAQLEIANKRLQAAMMMFHARFGMEQARLSMQGTESMYQFGRNALTGEDLTADNAPPAMLADSSGSPVPTRMQSFFAPTAATRGRGEQAATIVDAGEKLVRDIQANANMIGPLASRYNDLAQFIGNPPPEFKQLSAELESWIALHPAAHGFRGMKAVEQFQKAFGPIEMTPEALIAGIRGSYNTMGALENTAKPKTVGGGVPRVIKNVSGGSSVPSFADWQKQHGGH